MSSTLAQQGRGRATPARRAVLRGLEGVGQRTLEPNRAPQAVPAADAPWGHVLWGDGTEVPSRAEIIRRNREASRQAIIAQAELYAERRLPEEGFIAFLIRLFGGGVAGPLPERVNGLEGVGNRESIER